MNKTSIVITILVLTFIFAGADYLFNVFPSRNPKIVTAESQDSFPNLTQLLINKLPATMNYKLVSRNRVTHLFEKIDLSGLLDLRIYENDIARQDGIPIILYELHGAKNQGGLSYLNIKLKCLDQLDATENINETNEYGNSSFYFNDLNFPETAFLVVQTWDNSFGFRFNKKDLNDVKIMVQTLVKIFNS